MYKLNTLILIIFLHVGNFVPIEAQTIDNVNLTPIDFNDPILKDWQVWIQDTITPSGWEIHYFIKNDQRKYKDLYIQWSNRDHKGLCKFESVLEVNGISIPLYEGENNNSIFMTHACSSICKAVLILRKEDKPTYTDYLDIVNFSIDKGQLLYLTDLNRQQDTILQLSLVDLNTKQEYLINFNYACPAIFKREYIDTVVYGFDKTTIRVTFIENNKSIKDQRVIVLK